MPFGSKFLRLDTSLIVVYWKQRKGLVDGEQGSRFYWVEKSLSKDLAGKLGMKDRWRYGMIGGWILGLRKISSSRRLIVSPLMVHNLINDDTRSWNISHIEPFIPACEAAMIRSMPTSSPNTVDRLVWPAVKSGSYIVKFGYHATIYSSQRHHCDGDNNFHAVCDVMWKIIWGARPFPKLKTSCG